MRPEEMQAGARLCGVVPGKGVTVIAATLTGDGSTSLSAAHRRRSGWLPVWSTQPRRGALKVDQPDIEES